MVDSFTKFDAPVPLTAEHELEEFDSGEPSLDDWLKKRALANRESGASNTYVVCPSNSLKVAGFYALAAGQIVKQDVTAAIWRNMPDLIPAVVLGRLAVDVSAQGQGQGAALLLDAVERSLRAGSEVAVRLVMVHAISEAAAAFYERYGFRRLPFETLTLALDLTKLPK